MQLLVGFSAHAGVRTAEIGFLLILIAGVWLVAAETLDPQRRRRFRTTVAGSLLATAGILLIVAAHWGHFG